MTEEHKTLVLRLRHRYGLPESVVSDEALLKITRNDFNRACVELGMALEKLGATFKSADQQLKNKLFHDR